MWTTGTLLAGGNGKWYSQLRREFGSLYKMQHRYKMQQVGIHYRYLLNVLKMYVNTKNLPTSVYNSLFKITKTWK